MSKYDKPHDLLRLTEPWEAFTNSSTDDVEKETTITELDATTLWNLLARATPDSHIKLIQRFNLVSLCNP